MTFISKKTISLLKYTLVIGGSFYLGTIINSLSTNPDKELPRLSVKEFYPNLESGLKNNLLLEAGDIKVTINSSETRKWIESYVRDYSGKPDKRISYAAISPHLISIAAQFDTKPVDAKLNFKDQKADVFVPSANGRKLNTERSLDSIASAIFNNKASASLSFDTVEPSITLEKINDLGIKSLLGRGTSDYGKSHASRIHNLSLGMSKFNGVILKPGEEFSFNKLLGEVDGENGYQAELVIKGGLLEREYGGGLCQVSTTVFRAAILAGLTIKERKPHSFPVQYYNPQGFDSTIYPGVVDLKFINDTANHILIQTKVIGSQLSVEIYGSDDGRKVTMEGPVQYDRKPSGAMKAYFLRKIVMRDGTIKEERFDSVYKAPPPSPLERNPLE
ncbi:MAG: VanW family protein [bacterium]|nr:VanW family protein [bacterium]